MRYIIDLCCAISGVLVILGFIGVYIAMNNEEERVWRWIVGLVGAETVFAGCLILEGCL